jgi:hypothetical protein
MLGFRRGGYRECPRCKQIVETRVLLEGYAQIPYQGVLAKRRKVICWEDLYGGDGCGHEWYTLEVPDVILGVDSSPEPQNKRRKRHG